MRPLDHQQSRPPDPPPKPRPDPTPRGTSRKNRHPEHRHASDRTRARNDNQSRNAYLIGAFRLRRRGLQEPQRRRTSLQQTQGLARTTSGLSLNWLAVQCRGTRWSLSMISARVGLQINGAGILFQWLVKRWIASSTSATLVSVPRRRRRDFCGRDSRVSSGAYGLGRGSPS